VFELKIKEINSSTNNFTILKKKTKTKTKTKPKPKPNLFILLN